MGDIALKKVDDPRIEDKRRNLTQWILTTVLMKSIFQDLIYNKVPS